VRQRCAAVLVGMALLLAGCGGDDDSDSGSDRPETQATTQTQTQPETGTQTDTDGGPTREEYIAEADAFCKEANAEAKGMNERLQEAARSESTPRKQLAAIVPILEEGYEVQRRSRSEFKQIPHPPADREIVQRMHAAFDAQTDLVGRLLEAAEEGDLARFRTLTREQDRVKVEARGLARGYGFKECGSGKNEAD
jgi:hypothetical protein